MKNNFLFCNNNTSFFRNHSLKIFILTLLFSIKVNSQVRCYAFGESSGIYTSLSSSTNVFSSNWEDNVSGAISIGFAFNFNGTDYTSCFVNSNGYITFGTASGSGNYNPISSGNYSGAISAFGRDLTNNSSTIVRGVEGSAPNRVFVVQWNNARRVSDPFWIFSGNPVAGDNLNFQIRLYETTNQIEVKYGNCVLASDVYDVQVGLKGASNGDFNNRRLTSASLWLNYTDAGTSNSHTLLTRNTSRPVSGTTFSWTQPNKAAITSIVSDKDNVCIGGSVELQALGNSSGTSTLWFQDGCGTATFMEEWHSMPYTNQNTTINSIKNGILDITTSNLVDAQIDMSNLFTAEINTSIYKNIAIRYKVLSGSAGQSEIYFYKVNQSLAENKVVRGNLISDNNWHVLNIDMSTNPNWNNIGGIIKGWRFDYATGQSVKMQIDYITLTDRAVLENTNEDDSKITVYPLTTTNYFAVRSAESPCINITTCTSKTIYRGKTWNGGPTGDWSVASNWIPVGVPTSNDCIEVGNSLTMAITGSHAVGKTLNVSGGNFTVNSGSSITLKEGLTVAPGAIFTLEDSASLVQEGSTNINSGNIIVKRTAKPMKRFDYTYWSSPVANQSLHAFSPTTFFDKFHSWNPGSGTQAGYWQVHPSNGASVPMAAGKGYIVRAPQSFPVATVSSENFVGNFNGVPNSGDIQIAIAGNSSASVQKWNLIGNPYPSALNIDDFFNDSFNASNIYGTIYLWTHNTPISANNSGTSDLNYAASDYASYNGVGGTATSAATQNPLNPVINPSPNNAVPNGFIASGQSFFIRGKSNTNVRFTNAMRVRNNNNQFYRIGNVENQSTSVEKNRFWLNLRNTQGAFHQTLVGYVSGATNDLDDNFDGELFGGNFVSIYSVLADKKMTIQGKAVPFENTDAVQLGITTTIAGNFSISLDNFDGLFESQDILLKDNLLNLVHNLKTGGYEFTSGIGTFNDRFEIVYQSETLGNNTPDFNSNTILIYKNDKTIVVNSGISTISNVQVFDIQGRLLYDGKNVNNSETIIRNLPPTEQVLIVRVQTLEGNIVSKKIIY